MVRQTAKKRAARVSLPELTSLDALDSLEATARPAQELIDKLQTRLLEVHNQLLALRDVPNASEDEKASAEKEREAVQALFNPTSVESGPAAMARSKASRIWQNLANSKLVEMASSLAGALIGHRQPLVSPPPPGQHQALETLSPH